MKYITDNAHRIKLLVVELMDEIPILDNGLVVYETGQGIFYGVR